MADDRTRLLALAEAVSDGRAIDWDAESSSLDSEADRALVLELRLLAGVAEVRRSADEETSQPSPHTDDDPTESALRLTWGSLEIRERIGAGTFGTVYRAWDPRLARDVALKLLHGDPGAPPAAPNIIEEGRLLARVRHPHVITVFGADRFDEHPGIWMEFLRGRTLEDVLRQSGPLGAREAALIGIDLCGALAAVHRAGLIHRDVKSQNVMREEGGRIVLMDFGAGQDTDAGLRRPATAGTPLYLAPELFAGAQATSLADIYSLGVLLFHLVTGAYPVEGRTALEVFAAHGTGARRHLRDVRPDLPSDFIQVVERALAPDPAERFDSAGRMEQALMRALPRSRESGESLPAEGRSADAATPPRLRVRRRTLALLLGTAMAAAAIGFWRPGSFGPGTGSGRVQTVVVMPLRNLTGTPAQDYLADGLTDILISRLAMLKSVRVIARGSANAAARSGRSMASVLGDLGVEYVIEGSIQREGDRVRVAIQVLQGPSRALTWATTDERLVGNLFRLQGEVASKVAAAIRAHVSGAESRRLVAIRTTTEKAQEAYMQGRYLLYSFNRDNLVRARELFEAAIKEDPGYALPHASLARVLLMLEGFGLLRPEDIARPAVEAARRAVELAPDLPEALIALAETRFKVSHDWSGAEAAFESALDVAPYSALVESPFARFLSSRGRPAEALDHALNGQQSDPLSGEMAASVGITYYYLRRFPEALQAFLRSVAIEPRYGPGFIGLARTYSEMKDYQAAITQCGEAARLMGSDFSIDAEVARNHARAGRRAEAEAILGRMLSAAERKQGIVSPLDIAFVYAALEQPDEAFTWLERAVTENFDRALFLRVDPRADPIQKDARFAGVLTRLGLDD